MNVGRWRRRRRLSTVTVSFHWLLHHFGLSMANGFGGTDDSIIPFNFSASLRLFGPPGIPTLMYGLAATRLIRHREIVRTPRGDVTIYFLLPEDKGAPYWDRDSHRCLISTEPPHYGRTTLAATALYRMDRYTFFNPPSTRRGSLFHAIKRDSLVAAAKEHLVAVNILFICNGALISLTEKREKLETRNKISHKSDKPGKIRKRSINKQFYLQRITYFFSLFRNNMHSAIPFDLFFRIWEESIYFCSVVYFFRKYRIS